MTVRELIERLQELPESEQDLEVFASLALGEKVMNLIVVPDAKGTDRTKVLLQGHQW